MNVYTIRHKATGKFMPARMSRGSNRGWSHWEPTDDKLVFDKSPRVFFSLKSAQNALVQYCLGVHKRHYEPATNFWDDPGGEDFVEIQLPLIPRSRTDFEIITYEMVQV